MSKLNKTLKAIIEWLIAIILLIVVIYPYVSYGSFSALDAHQKSEKSFHYGPSDILEVIDFPKGKILLCKYDKWFSADTVIKKFVKWHSRDAGGNEIKNDEKLTYNWRGSRIDDDYFLWKFYGYVTSPEITKVILEVEFIQDNEPCNKSLEYTLKNHRGFIFYWNENEIDYEVKALKGLDNAGNILYEKYWD